MSQIPHSQLSLKKRSTPVSSIENDKARRTPTAVKNGDHKVENGSEKPPIAAKNGHSDKSNGHDQEVIILEDDLDVTPVDADANDSMTKKRVRPRSKKESTDSCELTPTKKDEIVAVETPKIDNLPMPELIIKKLSPESLSSSKRRSDRLQNASTIVNLSTVSSSQASDTTTTMETPSTERKVSGRRSTRPIDDIKFTYRSPDPDESIANATIGSEIGDSMLATPTTDRKRRIDSVEALDSPKRSRLDLSALFNNFYSPVTILRDKFRRTNLASTPKSARLDESCESIDTSASEMKEIDLDEKNEDNKKGGAGKVKFIVKPAKTMGCSVM